MTGIRLDISPPTPPEKPKPCDHDYHRAGTIGMCIIYECRKCGDEYEKDVS
jgi:hypothetical protein